MKSYILVVVGGSSGSGRCCIVLSSVIALSVSCWWDVDSCIISLSIILTDFRDRRFSAPRRTGTLERLLGLAGDEKASVKFESPANLSSLLRPLSSMMRGLVRDLSPKLLFRSEICG